MTLALSKKLNTSEIAVDFVPKELSGKIASGAVQKK